MGKNLRRIMTIGLCMAFSMGMISCSGKSKDVEMGRYLEEIYEMPDGITGAGGIEMLDDGTIALVAYDTDNNLKYYTSSDSGKTWSEKELNLQSEDGKELSVSDTTLSDKGDLFFTYYLYDSVDESEDLEGIDDAEDLESTEDSEEYSEEDEMEFYKEQMENTHYAVISSDGKMKELDLSEFTKIEDGDDPWSTTIDTFKFSKDGYLTFNYNYEELVVLDIEKNEVVSTIESDWINSYVFMGDSVIISSDEGINEYDLATGEEVGPVSLLESEFGIEEGSDNRKDNYYSLQFVQAKDDDIIYYLDDDGLFKCDFKSNKIEQLIDATLCSLGDTNMYVGHFIDKGDGTFLGLFDDWSSNESEFSLINYYYSEDTPKVPENQLVLYSLQENWEMRQAIVKYQKAHPDVYIKYEIGLSGDDAVTEADAIKALNTEVMSGSGPDIILLDGLPVDSYIQKGLLADMSEALKSYIDDGKIFDSIVNSYTEDGKIYNMPTRFSIPIVVGQKDVISKITDIKTFNETLEEIASKNEGNMFDYYMSPAEYAACFYYINAGSWLNDDNTINEDNLKEFLEETKKGYDAFVSTYDQDVIDEYNGYFNDYEDEYGAEAYNYRLTSYIDVINLINPNCAPIAFGNLDNINTLSEVYSLTKTGDYGYGILQGQDQNVFIPSGLVGISAKTEEKEIANDFVSYLFSEEMQNSVDYSSGFAVNIDAFNESCVYPYKDEEWYKEGESIGGYGTSDEDGKEYNLDIYWPDDDTINEFKEMVNTLTTPAQYNSTVFSAVISSFKSYANGDMTVDEAIKKIKDDINIYLSE